ncbi:hypothetical protein P5706_15050 [Pseudomonas sp. ChxA]|uniref:hypothetical protein n=1 Tax=Pseudomonas sp. ChxA TaxID=3035473 RepID=UPI0025525F52|nr:hypothetical protein [Pseudomonas sp. ChxA]MDL2185501.1 hypothetical protein [Pseudomonas sp. ChxA]
MNEDTSGFSKILERLLSGTLRLVRFQVLDVLVASRLALRWAAQQPHTITPDSPRRLNEGRLRHPTQGKPARHGGSVRP